MKLHILEEFENKFYDENFESPNGFELLEGKSNFMISAPHSVTQVRNGKLKLPEYRTGVIAYHVNQILGLPVIYKTKNLNDDANYDEKSEYRDALIEYIKENDIKFLMDIHLSSPEREYSIDIGTGRGAYIKNNEDIVVLFRKVFGQKYNRIETDYIFPALYPFTVSSQVHKYCRIPVIQLEINWNILDSLEKYDVFMECFIKFIKELRVCKVG